MSNKVIKRYPLRLKPELDKAVREDAERRKWSLATWYEEAVKMFLDSESKEVKS